MTPLTLTRINALLLPRSLGTSLTLPLEMIAAARAIARSHGEKNRLQTRMVSLDGNPVELGSGLRVAADCALADAPAADLVLIPGLWRSPRPLLARHPELIDWLVQQHRNGAVLVAAGTGVYLPAQAGLLDGQPATTHWYWFDHFTRTFPRIKLKPHHLITLGNRVYCAGSVNSVADLCVHLLEQAFDAQIAKRVAQQFSHEIRRDYRSIAYTEDAGRHQDELVIEMQQYLRDHLAAPLRMEALAVLAGVSVRTLQRRFRQATDLSPAAYLQQQRLRLARELLRDTNLEISAIAEQVGYPEPAHFSRLFKQDAGLSPSAFRRTLRGKLFSLPD